ncbi:MAG: hypothetical protein HQK60_00930 [Deltaproteobacteria bacterium]|nr:hypothetical protein [Deltaproteobacteria bacterium]
MENFYIGLELLHLWGIQDFQLLDFMGQGLRAYDQRGRLVVSYESLSELDKDDFAPFSFNLSREKYEAEAQLKAIQTFIFRLEDVRLFALANRLPSPQSKKEPQAPEPPPQPEVKVETLSEKRFRDRLACRKVAKRLWLDDPSIMITSMVERQEVIEASGERSASVVYSWIRDLSPSHKPGRRKK